MSAYENEKLIGITIPDITPVVHELIQHYQERGYEVSGAETEPGGWEIAITKRGIIRGKTALNIAIQRQPGGTLVRARAPVAFRGQDPPTAAIMMFVAWPEVRGS